MVVPNIPNNSLTEEIKEIVSLCQQLEDRYDSYFNPPASEEEIIAWENEHGITIPETYKDWLRFSNGSGMKGRLADFWGVKKIGSCDQFLPNDLVTIGELIGDGEYLCFSKKTGKIIWEDHGKMREYDNLNEVINEILDIM